MRPVKLTMQAFGPFLERVEIPFFELGASNIFLISGNTGSGKTTIFDAVCFALFNNSSGSFRGNSTLRSHYASENVKSFVEFEFLFKGENYKIKRTPQGIRKKLKGEGFIKENPTAELFLPDGRIIYNLGEVDKYVVDLLGLNLSQFSQIALLAQGEFLKLLNSTTNERNEIFRTIFNTDIFLDFQNNLKDEYSKLKLEISNLNLSILQFISQIKTKDEKTLELIDFIKQNEVFLSLSDLIEKLGKINKENDEKLIFYQNENEKITSQKENCLQIYKKIQEKNILLKNKLEICNEINKQKEIFKKIENEFKSLSLKNQQADFLKEEIKELEQKIDKIKKIEKIEKELLKNNNEIEKLNLEIDKTKEKIKNFKIQFLNFKNNELQILNKNKELKQKEFEKINKEFKNLRKKYDEKYEIYLSSQAGILAKTLKDNSPCPVCGSIEHPFIAKVQNCEITKEILDELKKDVEFKTDKLSEISNECSILIEKIKTKEVDIANYIKDNFEITPLCEDNYFQNIDFENEIKYENDKLKEDLLKTQNLTLDNASIKAQIKTLYEKDDENFDNQQNLKSLIEELSKKHLNLKNNLNNLIFEIETINKNYKSENDKLISLISKDEVFNKQLEEMREVDVLKTEEIEQKIDDLKEKQNKNNLEISSLNLIKGVNDEVYSNLIVQNKQLNIKYKSLESLDNLYKTASGNLKGRQKITFEQYIQHYYLDLVLIEANKILKILSKNQFQFLRNKGNLSSQIKSSLDIEIMDFYTYKTRSTKTLSGGESFLASLALALGLSNVASNLSGNKNIDMLFIDEGFGSLDNESLDKAIDVIVELSAKNRLIGVISHIEELKNAIQNQIKTTKTPQGSTIEIQFLC